LRREELPLYEEKDHPGKSCAEAHGEDPSPVGHKAWKSEQKKQL